jgi:hypothetical protein
MKAGVAGSSCLSAEYEDLRRINSVAVFILLFTKNSHSADGRYAV